MPPPLIRVIPPDNNNESIENQPTIKRGRFESNNSSDKVESKNSKNAPSRFSLTIPNSNSQNSEGSQSSARSRFSLTIPSNNTKQNEETNNESENESSYTYRMKPNAVDYEYPSFKQYYYENKEGTALNMVSLFNKLDKLTKTGIAVGGHRFRGKKFIKIYLFITGKNPDYFSLDKFYKEIYFQQEAAKAINGNSGSTEKNGFRFSVPAIHQYGEIAVDDIIVDTYRTLTEGKLTYNPDTIHMSYVIMDLTDGICIRPMENASNKKTRSNIHTQYKKGVLTFTKNNQNNLAMSVKEGAKNWGESSNCYLLPLPLVLNITLNAHDLLKMAGIYHNDLGNGNNILYDGTTFVITDFGEATDIPDMSRSFTMYAEYGFGGKRRTRKVSKRKAHRTRSKKSRRSYKQ